MGEFFVPIKLGHISAVLDKPEGNILGTAIIMHGRRSNKNREGYRDVGNIALSFNYQVVRFDFRGHGESFDAPSWDKYGVMDQHDDISRVYNYLKEADLLKGKIVLIPSSFSADPALLFASSNPVDCIIMISPGEGKNSANTQDNRFRKEWWDKNISTTQIPFSQYKKKLQQISIPIHSLHGDSDESVPMEQSQELQEIIGNNFVIHTIKDGLHKYAQPQGAMIQRQNIIKEICNDKISQGGE